MTPQQKKRYVQRTTESQNGPQSKWSWVHPLKQGMLLTLQGLYRSTIKNPFSVTLWSIMEANHICLQHCQHNGRRNRARKKSCLCNSFTCCARHWLMHEEVCVKQRAIHRLPQQTNSVSKKDSSDNPSQRHHPMSSMYQYDEVFKIATKVLFQPH